MESLKEIKGVGESLREEISSAYGSEESAIEELSRLNFIPLFYSPINATRAQEVARQFYCRILKFSYSDLLGTPMARELYSQMLKALKKEASTTYGRARMALWAPVSQRREIERRQEIAGKAMRLVESLGGLEEVKSQLGKIEPFSQRAEKKLESHCLAVEDRELYGELKAEYSNFIDVFLVESPEDLEFLSSYELVRYVEGGLGLSVEALGNTLSFSSFREADVLPEMIIFRLEENLPSLKALERLIRLTEGLDSDGLIKFMPGSAIEEVISTLAYLQEGKAVVFSRASQDFGLIVEEILRKANQEVEERIRQMASIEGEEVLNLLSGYSSGSMYEALPEKVKEVISGVAEDYEVKLAERLGLGEEGLMFSGIISFGYPLALDQEKVNELSAWLNREAVRREFEEAREVAGRVKGYLEDVEGSINSALELDFLIAIGSFALSHRAVVPELVDRPALGFKSARHLSLAMEDKAQPVSYSLGDSSIGLKGSRGEKIAVITGANSGGKTTLLETIAYLQIASQCGLPVLAEKAEMPLLERLYFFAKPRSSSSAGAFESLLESFSEMSRSKGRSLILADELEAVTEPGAAAKVLGAFIEWFSSREETLLALVTHLGEELSGEVKNLARVDGIEARGLDENLNLVVSRNPVLGKLARSTPELIVERLGRKNEDPFYRFLLAKFSGER